MIAVARYSLFLVQGLLLTVAARLALEVLLVKFGLPFAVAVLAEFTWLAALFLVAGAWQRRAAPRYSWLALLRAAILAPGIAATLLGGVLYLHLDRSAFALFGLACAGLAWSSEHAAARVRRMEARQALVEWGRTRAA